MTIEMSSPEEILQPELVAIAKGATTTEARRILHEKVKNSEPIAITDVEKVNTPFRRELMKRKTRELRDYISIHNPNPDDNQLHLMLDMYDYLAIDWVYSNALLWNGSLACEYAQKIKDYLIASSQAGQSHHQ